MKNRLFSGWVVFFVCLIAPVVFCGCGGGGGDDLTALRDYNPTNGTPTSNGSTGTISGNVTASSSIAKSFRLSVEKISASVGIGSADVWLEDYSNIRGQTGNTGSFTLSNVPFGSQRVVAKIYSSGGSYKVRSGVISLSTSSPVSTAGELPLATANRIVRGVLRDNDGNPIVNATLSLWGETFTTNANGEFETPPLPENVDTEVIKVTNAANFQKMNFSAPFSSSKNPVTLEVTLPRTADTNRPPFVVLSSSKIEVTPGEQVSLVASASDPDTSDLSQHSVIWEQTDGIIGTGTDRFRATWIAPSKSGIATVTVRITDPQGMTGAARLLMFVGGGTTPTNNPPTATIIGTNTVFAGNSLEFSVSAGDPDNDPISILWGASQGSFSSRISTSTIWTSPSSTGQATIRCVVTDNKGAAVLKTMLVSIIAVPTGNRPPTAAILGPDTVSASGSAGYYVQASDPDADFLTFQWSAPFGYFSSNSAASVTWYTSVATGAVALQCLVSDGRGGQVLASKTVYITGSANRAPTGYIWVATTSVAVSSSTVLGIVANDPDSDPLSYSWTSSNGSFSSTTAATVTWVAPSSAGTSGIGCTVSDGRGGSFVASLVMIISQGGNRAPTGSIYGPEFVRINSSWTYTIMATDADGDAISKVWIANGGVFRTGSGTAPSVSGNSATWQAPASAGNFQISCQLSDGRGGSSSASFPLKVTTFTLTSAAFSDGGNIPATCSYMGGNISPSLSWTNSPPGVITYALVVQDFDSVPPGFGHWGICNISASSTSITASQPKTFSLANGSKQVLNDFPGFEYGYGGPDPGSSTHKYYFRLFALDTSLTVNSSFTVSNLNGLMGGHILDSVILTGYYP